MSDQSAIRTAEAERDRRSVEERRTQLVGAAAEVIASDGLDRATTRRITDHADLALGAFHYAFRSKDELLASVIETFGDQLDASLRSWTSDDPQPRGAAVIEQLTSGFWTEVDRSPNQQLARYELMIHALRHPRLRGTAEAQHERHVRTVADALVKLDDTSTTDAEELARFFLATMDGLILQFLTHAEHIPAEQRVAQTMRCLRSLLPAQG